MPTINMRVVELLTKEKHSTINSFYILARTNNSQYQCTKMKIISNKYTNILTGEKPSSLFIRAQHNDFLNIDLKRYHFISKDDLIGQVVLPLEWFPTNHMVREWFPIQKSGEFQGGMILLDIHIDSRNVQPFMAPFAALRVFPCWERPTFSENSEIPVIPPVVYVMAPQVNSSMLAQEQNLIPQVQEYVNVVDLPINPYSNRYKKNDININYPELNNPYNQKDDKEDQLAQISSIENQQQQHQKQFQIYSLDISDDVDNENINQQQSVPNVNQFQYVYNPIIN